MIIPTESKVLECRRCGAGNRVTLERAFTAPEKLRCGRCKAALLLDRDAAWHGPQVIAGGEALTNEGAVYQHPLDRDALAALHKIPGIDTLLKKAIHHTLERYDRLFHQASFVRAGDGQLPTLYALFEKAATRLGIEQPPDLFLYTDPVPNAHTSGVEKPFVAVSSGLVDMMDDDEVGAVLAHELAHWQCRHVLYKLATRLILDASALVASFTLNLSNVFTVPLRLALLEWDRCSELSADRGMLLATRDPELSLRVLFKLAGGSFRLRQELSLDKFLEQAEQARAQPQEGVLDRLFTLWQTLYRTHPFPLFRAAELWRWACGDEYLKLIQAS